MPDRPGMTLLDLGCGTGSLARALADRMQSRGRIVGIDRSERRLERARLKASSSPVPIEFRHGSIEALPFDGGSVDGICISQVLHALPEEACAQALAECARVLRPGGFLGLTEWSRPRFGYVVAVWGLSLLRSRDTRNWHGTYPELAADLGLDLIEERYLDSLNRCQIMTKRR